MNKQILGRNFGDAKFLGTQEEQDFFFDPNLSDEIRAMMLGYSEACPVVPRLIKPIREGGKGAKEMAKRYGEVIFWFNYICEMLRESGRSDIAELLTSKYTRSIFEPLGEHDEGWPPEELEQYYFRTPVAYGLPRMIAEFHRVEKDSGDSHLALLELDNVILENILNSTSEKDTPISDDVRLSVHLAERLVVILLDKGKRSEAALLLRHLISIGRHKEDNTTKDFLTIFRVMGQETPDLWNFYKSLSPEEKKAARMIDLNTFLEE